ncbi:MAG: MFS transporter [Burkholderiaceae bacterium]
MPVLTAEIPLTNRQRNLGLFSLMTSTPVALTGQFLISPILVFQLNSQGFSPAAIGMFSALGWLGILMTTPFTATLSSRLGVRPVLLLSLFIPVICLAGIMATRSVALWALLYFAIGFGSALRWIVGEALIASLAPAAWRGRIVGIFQMLLGTAFVVAPSLLAWLGPTNPNASWASLALLMAGLALTCLMPAIENKGTTNEAGHRASAGGLSLLKLGRTSPLIVIAGFAGGFFELGISSVMPVYGMAIGFSAAMAAMLIAASGLGSSLIMLPVGLTADRFGAALPMRLCACALVACALLLPLVVYQSALAWLTTFVWGAAGGALYTLTMIRIGQTYRGSELINTTSLLVLCYTLGGLAGPVLTGLALEISVQWALSGLYLVISCVALWVLTRRRYRVD